MRSLTLWDCGFESRRGHGCLSVVSVVCCQVDVSVSDRSLIQRGLTECGVSSDCDGEGEVMTRNRIEAPQKNCCYCVFFKELLLNRNS